MKVAATASDDSKHSADLEAILVHNDFVYSCADDGMVKVWSKDLVLQKEIKAHDYAVYDLLIHGDRLFTASIDFTIKVWRLPSLELIDTLKVHEESVRKLATNGKKLFSGDEKGEIITMDLETLVSKNRYETVEEVWGLAVSENRFFSVRDRGLHITEIKDDDTSKYSVVKSFQARAPIYLSKDYLLFCEFGTGLKIIIHKNQPNEYPKLKEIQAHAMIITCLAGGKVGNSEKFVSGAYDNEVKLWQLPDGALIDSLPLAVTPSAIAMEEGGTIYVGASDGYLVKLTA